MRESIKAYIALAIFATAGCGGGGQRPVIVGAWQERIGARRIWEFRADGTAELRTQDRSFSAQGTWKWLEDGRLRYEIRGGTFSTQGTHAASIEGSRLTLTENGISVVLDRR